MIVFDDFSKVEPDFVNEKGIKFWQHSNINRILKRRNIYPKFVGYYVESEYVKVYLIIRNEDGLIVKETIGLEDAYCFAEVLHLTNL